jgi:hypothetical protein
VVDKGWQYISTPPVPYPIRWFQADATGKRGQPVHLLALVEFSAGCTRDTRLHVQVDDAARLVRLNASDRYLGGLCALSPTEEYYVSSFIPARAGRYQVVADDAASATVEVSE